MNFDFRITYIILILLLGIYGCKEEGDIQSPKIIIESPSDGSQYIVGEKILVKALISDNNIVENIEIRLNRLSNNAKVGESIFLTAGSAMYSLETYYPLNDTLLSSDEYYLTITAFDGNQEGKAFQIINISGLPKKKLSDVVVISDGNSTTVVELNNNNTQTILHTFNSDYGGTVFSSIYQMMYFSGEYDNKLFGFDMKTSTERWVKTYSTTSSAKTFNYLGIDVNENNIGISLTSGYTDVLSPFGSVMRSFQPLIGMIPHRHFIEDKLTFIETFSHNNSVHKMETFYSNTAAPFDSRNINFQIVNVFEVDENKAYIFSNVSGGSNLYDYTYSSKNIRTADNLVNDSLISVIQVEENIYLVAGNKHVYKYFLPSGSLIELLNGVKAEVMEYDQLNGEIYIGNGSTLDIYEYNTGNFKTSMSFPSEIKNIIFRYNI